MAKKRCMHCNVCYKFDKSRLIMANPSNSCSKHGSFFLFVTVVSWSGPFLPVQSDSSLWPCGCGRSWSTISPWHLSACWGLRLGPFNLNEPTSHNYWKDILVTRHSDNAEILKRIPIPFMDLRCVGSAGSTGVPLPRTQLYDSFTIIQPSNDVVPRAGPRHFGRAAMPIEFHRISHP